jgi:hypothetical protein
MRGNRRIREKFGLENALDYLIGEKLFSFLHAAERDPLFAAEVPAFIGEIRRLFTAKEIRDYLDHLERTDISLLKRLNLNQNLTKILMERKTGWKTP